MGRHPKTGERRQRRRPLSVDSLPQKARSFIQDARAYRCTCDGRAPHGHSWAEIEALSKERTKIYIPHATAHRWYDLRIEQARKEQEERDELAERNLRRYLGKSIQELPEAAVQALKEQVFGLQQARTPDEQEKALGGFLFLLTKLMSAQAARDRAKLEKEKVALARSKFEQMAAKARALEKDIGGGKKKLSEKELRRRLRDLYGIAEQK